MTALEPRVQVGVLGEPASVALGRREREHLVFAPRLPDVERLGHASHRVMELGQLGAQVVELGPGAGERLGWFERLDPGDRGAGSEQIEQGARGLPLSHEGAGVLGAVGSDVELAHEAGGEEVDVGRAVPLAEKPLSRSVPTRAAERGKRGRGGLGEGRERPERGDR